MTPATFFRRYIGLLPSKSYSQFADDLIELLKHERARVRRQLTTDRAAYEEACFQTQNEIDAYGGTCG